MRLAGDPADQLGEHSAGLDLMLAGSRGYGPLRSVLVGGVSGRLMRTVQCPMIVVPRGVQEPLGALFATETAAALGSTRVAPARDGRAQRRPRARRGLHIERPTHQRQPLTHAEQAEAGGALLEIEALPVVADHYLDVAGSIADADLHAVGLPVLERRW